MRYNGSKGDEALKEGGREGCCVRQGGGNMNLSEKVGREGGRKNFSPASGRNDLPQSSITPCLVEHSIKTNMPLRYDSVDIEEGPTVYQSFSKKEFICNGAHLRFCASQSKLCSLPCQRLFFVWIAWRERNSTLFLLAFGLPDLSPL